MKKIIYVLLILLGGVLISSNFNVDSSKLDHKKVSASGVACKWISESGYGIGPIYINEGDNNAYINNEKVYVAGIRESSEKGAYNWDNFNMMPCSIANSIDTPVDGSVLYEKKGTDYLKYTGFLVFEGVASDSLDYLFMSFEEGKVKKIRFSDTNNHSISAINTYGSDVPEDFNPFYQIEYKEFLAFHSINKFSSTSFSSLDVGILNYESDGMYTCVCAEY